MAENVNKQFVLNRASIQAQQLFSRLDVNDRRLTRGSAQMLVYGVIDDIRIEHPESYVRSGKVLAPYVNIRGHIKEIDGELNGEMRHMYLNQEYQFEYHYRLNHAERQLFDVDDNIGIYAGDDNVFNKALNDYMRMNSDNTTDTSVVTDEYGNVIRMLDVNEARFYEVLDFEEFLPDGDSRSYVALHINKILGTREVFDGTFEWNEYDIVNGATELVRKSQLKDYSQEHVNVISKEELLNKDAEDYLDSIFEDDYEEEEIFDEQFEADFLNSLEDNKTEEALFNAEFSPEANEMMVGTAEEVQNDIEENFELEEEEVAPEEPTKRNTGFVKEEMEQRKQQATKPKDERSIYEKPDKLEVFYEDTPTDDTKEAEDDLFV